MPSAEGTMMGVHSITSLQEQELETANCAARELLTLQLEQFHHDEMYHREIARLSIHHRLSHMVLHLSKYLGLYGNEEEVNDRRLNQAIVDSIIIGLSTANILNLKISEKLAPVDSSITLLALCKQLAAMMGLERFDRLSLLKRAAVAIGRMAKGCESIDHLEAFPFRESITDGLIEILKVLLANAALREIDVAAAVRSRLAGVKSKSIFHGKL